ncbi:MAG: acetaldehyde dehydrogenase (acetylating) [Ignavibacteria bacterium]|nr:acetaldehyde dehydrogenase (acetylating) [Ignavibacteria bacterium]
MDNDLYTIQAVREFVQKAKDAQLQFREYSQEKVDRIVKAMVDAGFDAAEYLGKLAHEETGFGKVEDKKKKNEFATRHVWDSIKDLKTVGVIRQDKQNNVIEIAEPMGVVCALIPSTNPTSTVMFKSIISVKGRNAIVASPHPRAINCTWNAMKIIREAAESAGAPQNLLSCLTAPTMDATNELMKHKLVSIILATGSNSMVRAAYSSGKPAYGVGSGNVPAFIERSANIKKAVADIISGKLFDYGVLCSTESGLICDRHVKSEVIEEMNKHGAYFCSREDKEKLARTMFDTRGSINANMVGKSAAFIAQNAGIKIPETTSVLVAEVESVGKQEPLSREKLSPVLSFMTADDWREGCHRCIEMLEFGGIGHTMVIHSSNEDIIMKFAMEKPAFRILVNTQSALGAVGFTTGLKPSMTLGPGTIGGSIISDNVSAIHMINVKRLAYETNPINPIENNSSPKIEIKEVSISTPIKEIPLKETVRHVEQLPQTTSSGSWLDIIDERIRLKAGNVPVLLKQEVHPSQQTQQFSPSDKKLGMGISIEEVNTIIQKFST